MDRKSADKHLEYIKNCNHNDIKMYKHLAKLLDFILYEIDKIREIETMAPSIYGSWAGDPNYNDYDEEAEASHIELPEVEIEEVSASVDYIDGATVPMVLAVNGLMAPFRMDESEPSEEKETPEPPKEEPKKVEKNSGETRNANNSDGPISPTTKPKRLRIETEKDKGALHTEALKKVKAHLKSIKKKSKKG